MKKDEEFEKNQPSTSSGAPPARPKSAVDANEKEEIVQLWKHLDETLESKAKSLNLTSLNVKSILHHLIKYPNAIHVLMGLGGESNVPNMRMTRSQRKPTDEASSSEKMSVFIESLAGNEPKTFLDLNFDDNDEFDDDYVEDEEIDEEEEEIDEPIDPFERMDLEEESSKNNNQTNIRPENLNDASIHEENDKIEHMDNWFDKSDENPSTSEYRSYVNPEYQEFINAVINEKNKEEPVVDDDPDDEDYDVQVDDDDMALDVDEWYETRHDRATEIPRYEVERLMMDTILAEKEIPAEALPKEAISQKTGEVIKKPTPGKKTQKEKDAEVVERLKKKNSTTESCTLLTTGQVTFRDCEIEQLKLQLEQHVQLLTQFVVTCHCDKNVVHVKNTAQIMINELDNFYQNYGVHSIYNIPNLGDSIESCHDILQMVNVPRKFIRWAVNTDGYIGPAPRPESIAVLSRSKAIRYPSLIPKVEPDCSTVPVPFTKSENLMLALALLQFAHLPRRSDCGLIDRYTAISIHCLPSRSPNTIRNHMKTMRNVHEKSSPMHLIITQAEQGICELEFPVQPVLKFEGGIQNWPSEYQPMWYKMFIENFKLSPCLHRVFPINETFGSLVVVPIKVKNSPKEEKYVRLGTIGNNEQPVIMEKEHVVNLVNQIFPEVEISPSKRRKNATPVKRTNFDASEVSYSYDDNEENTVDTSSMFPPPPTPGRRPPSDMDDLSISMSTFDNYDMATTSRAPMTPRTSEDDDVSQSSGGKWVTDFRHLHEDRSKMAEIEKDEVEMHRKSVMSIQLETNSTCPILGRQTNFDTDCESQLLAKKRKRSRVEKETMGKQGMGNRHHREMQKCNLARKMMADVKNRLFMHQQKWKKLVEIMTNNRLDEEEKVEKIVELFGEKMREVMHLLLAFTPVEILPLTVLKDPKRHLMLAAINMMLDINAYITAAKMKSPTTRQIFKLIMKLGIENRTSLETAHKMHQLLGHERPLWDKIEKNFYSLAHRDRRIRSEDFEFIDLTRNECQTLNNYEIIDDIDIVLNPRDVNLGDHRGRANLFVKSGQLMAINSKKGQIVPVEVIQNKWTKMDDMALLLRYNQAILENSDLKIEQMPELMRGKVPFGPKSICERLEYLLSML